MAAKKGVGHAYNIDFLNVVFAASSIFLLLSVIWMVWDDFDREWKQVQRRFGQLERAVTQASLEQASQDVDRDRLAELEAERGAQQAVVDENRAQIGELDAQMADVEVELNRVTQQAQFAKATYDVNRYAFEAARDRGENVEDEAAEIAAEAATVDGLNLEVERVTSERTALQTQLTALTGELDRVAGEIRDLTAEETRLRGRLEDLAPDFVRDYVRNAPLIDFMAPTIRVQQIITPNIVDDVNFTRIPKMDRCMTCHLAIDREGYEEYPQPYTTHPNLSAYIGADSPHPLGQIGCTVCHEGMGQSISFVDAAHVPSGAEQQEEWEAEYGWEEPHLWDFPMLPTEMTEASCAKCHRQEVYIPEADTLNVAYQAIERAGCYACHVIRGFQDDVKKPGPLLTRISAKLSEDWVKNWIRNPRAIKPSTWMPKPWYNSNTGAPEDAVWNEVEINAVAAYLFANAEPYEFEVPNPPRGDAARGQAVVESVGCLGCHVVEGGEDRLSAGLRRTFGQPLQSIGSKTSYEWVYNWVRDPKHYNAATYMPNLRLTDAEVADVATYLMTLTGSMGDPAPVTPTPDDVDRVLVDYLRAAMPLAEAEAQVASMSADEKQVDLGQRVIGRYGCFSCHQIDGFENTQPIGIELSEEGSKLVSRLDFAFAPIEHSKVEWFRHKVLDPRGFDQGRVLTRAERARMPDFGMSEEEADLFVTAIMSFQREIQPDGALPAGSARRDALVTGRALVRRRNCVGCHQIEGDGGDYVQVVSDPTLAPPLLTPEGAKVQPDWLYAFLRGPITIRPWLDVRMPTFGLDDPHLNGVIRYFGAISESVGPFRTHEPVQASNLLDPGDELFELLRCQQCHVLGDVLPDDLSTAAPDLRMAPERLQPDWILQWLVNPQAIQPGTRMPQFWPDFPETPFPGAGGLDTAALQIQAVRDHLLTFRGGPDPRRAAGTRPAD